MHQKSRVHSLIAIATAFCVAFTQVAVAAPALTTTPEVSLPSALRVDQAAAFSVPSAVASVEKQISGSGKTVFHIQTAHGNYQAEKNIESLLAHLEKNYGVNTLLVEGASNPLNPEIINFFPEDRKATLEAVDAFVRHSVVSGSEVFLLNSGKALGLGIEDEKSYEQNLQDFVAVVRARVESSQFLSDLDRGIERLSAIYASSDLRSFTARVEKKETGDLPFDAYLQEIKAAAVKHLELDLSDASWQVIWPQLTRVFAIEKLEKRIDAAAFKKQKENFLKAIKPYAAREIADEVEKLLSLKDLSARLPDPETSILFEALVQALPTNFNYDRFSSVTAFAGMLMLKSQVRAEDLAAEITRLEDKITDKLAETKNAKSLVAVLKDYRLLKKLFALELLPSDFEHLKKTSVQPSGLVARLKQINGIARAKEVTFGDVAGLDALYEKAIRFYEGARLRDEKMLARVEERLAETGADKVAVVTGGFHAEPFAKYFEGRGYTYALMTPKITDIDSEGRQHYLDVMQMWANKPSQASSVMGTQLRPEVGTIQPEVVTASSSGAAVLSMTAPAVLPQSLLFRFLARAKISLRTEQVTAGSLAPATVPAQIIKPRSEARTPESIQKAAKQFVGRYSFGFESPLKDQVKKFLKEEGRVDPDWAGPIAKLLITRASLTVEVSSTVPGAGILFMAPEIKVIGLRTDTDLEKPKMNDAAEKEFFRFMDVLSKIVHNASTIYVYFKGDNYKPVFKRRLNLLKKDNLLERLPPGGKALVRDLIEQGEQMLEEDSSSPDSPGFSRAGVEQLGKKMVLVYNWLVAYPEVFESAALVARSEARTGVKAAFTALMILASTAVSWASDLVITITDFKFLNSTNTLVAYSVENTGTNNLSVTNFRVEQNTNLTSNAWVTVASDVPASFMVGAGEAFGSFTFAPVAPGMTRNNLRMGATTVVVPPAAPSLLAPSASPADVDTAAKEERSEARSENRKLTRFEIWMDKLHPLSQTALATSFFTLLTLPLSFFANSRDWAEQQIAKGNWIPLEIYREEWLPASIGLATLTAILWGLDWMRVVFRNRYSGFTVNGDKRAEIGLGLKGREAKFRSVPARAEVVLSLEDLKRHVAANLRAAKWNEAASEFERSDIASVRDVLSYLASTLKLIDSTPADLVTQPMLAARDPLERIAQRVAPQLARSESRLLEAYATPDDFVSYMVNVRLPDFFEKYPQAKEFYHGYLVAFQAGDKVEATRLAAEIDKLITAYNKVENQIGEYKDNVPDFAYETLVQADVQKVAEEYSTNEIRQAQDFVLDGGDVTEFFAAGAATRLGLGNMFLLSPRKFLMVFEVLAKMRAQNTTGLSSEEQAVFSRLQAREEKDLQALDAVSEKSIALLQKMRADHPGFFDLPMAARILLMKKANIEALVRERLDGQSADVIEREIKQAVANQKMSILVNEEVAGEAIDYLKENNFFGFDSENIFFTVQPTFKGFGVDLVSDVVKEVTQAELVNGHGYPTMQKFFSNQAFYISADGQAVYLDQPLVDVLYAKGAKILSIVRINDMIHYDNGQTQAVGNSLDTPILIAKIKEMGGFDQLDNPVEGADLVLELLDNPGKQKGGSFPATPSLKQRGYGVMPDTLAFDAKGDPETKAAVERIETEIGSGMPYNRMSQSYKLSALVSARKNGQLKGLSVYLRWREFDAGKPFAFAAETVTGDTTYFLKTKAVMQPKRNIRDFKTAKEIPALFEIFATENTLFAKLGYARSEQRLVFPRESVRTVENPTMRPYSQVNLIPSESVNELLPQLRAYVRDGLVQAGVSSKYEAILNRIFAMLPPSQDDRTSERVALFLRKDEENPGYFSVAAIGRVDQSKQSRAEQVTALLVFANAFSSKAERWSVSRNPLNDKFLNVGDIFGLVTYQNAAGDFTFENPALRSGVRKSAAGEVVNVNDTFGLGQKRLDVAHKNQYEVSLLIKQIDADKVHIQLDRSASERFLDLPFGQEIIVNPADDLANYLPGVNSLLATRNASSGTVSVRFNIAPGQSVVRTSTFRSSVVSKASEAAPASGAVLGVGDVAATGIVQEGVSTSEATAGRSESRRDEEIVFTVPSDVNPNQTAAQFVLNQINRGGLAVGLSLAALIRGSYDWTIRRQDPSPDQLGGIADIVIEGGRPMTLSELDEALASVGASLTNVKEFAFRSISRSEQRIDLSLEGVDRLRQPFANVLLAALKAQGYNSVQDVFAGLGNPNSVDMILGLPSKSHPQMKVYLRATDTVISAQSRVGRFFDQAPSRAFYGLPEGKTAAEIIASVGWLQSIALEPSNVVLGAETQVLSAQVPVGIAPRRSEARPALTKDQAIVILDKFTFGIIPYREALEELSSTQREVLVQAAEAVLGQTLKLSDEISTASILSEILDLADKATIGFGSALNTKARGEAVEGTQSHAKPILMTLKGFNHLVKQNSRAAVSLVEQVAAGIEAGNVSAQLVLAVGAENKTSVLEDLAKALANRDSGFLGNISDMRNLLAKALDLRNGAEVASFAARQQGQFAKLDLGVESQALSSVQAGYLFELKNGNRVLDGKDLWAVAVVGALLPQAVAAVENVEAEQAAQKLLEFFNSQQNMGLRFEGGVFKFTAIQTLLQAIVAAKYIEVMA